MKDQPEMSEKSANSMSHHSENTCRILSLCGGGLSGAFSAAFLRDIEENTGKRLVDHFDLITGTSTGGIIALGLGLGIPASQLYDFYRDKGRKIFPQNVVKGLRWLHRSKYSAEALKQELRSVFGDRLLSESEIPLVVPSFNLGMNQVRLFKTRHNERFEIDHKIPAWKIARATSAAPTYLPVCREIFGLQLIDGGVWANNPVLVGLTESLSQFDVTAKSIRVLSIGTTIPVKRCRKKLDHAGVIGWPLALMVVWRRLRMSIPTAWTFW
ncbi:MAG: CBASS cGAMP-activated phospholipase [Alphaproteobacteria bacterium]